MEPIGKNACTDAGIVNNSTFYETFLGTLSQPDYKKFRYVCQRGLITYKTKICKTEMEKFMNKIIKDGFRVCYIAHEESDINNQYSHTHVLVDWDKKLNKSCSTFLDFNKIVPDIRKICNKKNGWMLVSLFLKKIKVFF